LIEQSDAILEVITRELLLKSMPEGKKIIRTALNESVSEIIVTNWKNSIKVENELLPKFSILTKSFLEKLSSSERLENTFLIDLEYYNNLYDLIQTKRNGSGPLSDIPDFPLFYGKIETVLGKIPSKIREEQSADRFNPLQDDSVFKRSFKIIKKGLYQISVLPVKLLNKLRILFKKEPVMIRYWSHTIRYGSLVKLHLENEFLLDLERYKYSINSRIATILNEAWNYLNSTLPDESEYVSNGKYKVEVHLPTIEEKIKDFENQIKNISDHIP
jgi:hypothetical protein